MFSLFPARPDRHVIDNGLVACELRKRDVEIDVCAGCRWLGAIDCGAAIPVVRCNPQTTRFVPWPLR